ncbi:MAG: globin family protein [Synoicihabitans sp.]
MTATEISHVQSSWAKVVPIADTAATLFYQRLFEIDPDLRPLFPEDMVAQKRKLMTAIGAAVRGLDDLKSLVPILQQMGARHVNYGVKPEHYSTVGSALLWTLEQGLGVDFTAEVKDAWSAVYGVIAETMQAGAKAIED